MSTASILIHSLGWALVHSLWQGALIFAALRVVLFLSPSMNARLKYHCSLASLFAMFTWFLITYLQEWQKLQTVIVKVTEGAGKGYKEYYIATLPPSANAGFGSFLVFMERIFPWLIPIYIIGVVLLAGRFTINLWQLRSWKRNNIQQPPLTLVTMLEQLKDEFQITKTIQLLISEKINVPVVFGMLKPVILLPISALAQLSTDQLEAILVHELAHIRRNDYLLNIVQTIIETLLFFNPFTHLVSSIIRREREHCCDDLVLRHTAHPLPYAKALAALDALRLQPGSAAMAATGQKNHLLNRIKRIMEMKKQSFRSSHVFIAIALVACLVVSVVWLTPAIAQNKKQSKKEQSKRSSSSMTISVNDDEVVVDSNGVTRVYKTGDDIPPHVAKHIVETVVPQSLEAAEAAMYAAEVTMQDIPEIVTDAMAAVDWDQIDHDVTTAIAEVDWDKVDKDMQIAVAEAKRQMNDPKMKKEIRRQMADARKEMAEARKEMARAKKETMEAAREMRKANAEGASEEQKERMREQRERAQEMREKAEARRDELNAEREEREVERAQRQVDRDAKRLASSERNNEMLAEMEKDGLLSRSKGYSIMKSDNTLLINGKQQSERVLRKYSKYLKGDNIIIKGKEKETTIIED